MLNLLKFKEDAIKLLKEGISKLKELTKVSQSNGE